MTLEVGGLPEATPDQDAAGGLAHVKWRPCLRQGSGPVKMEMPWLKLQATIKMLSESTAEMDRISKCSTKHVARVIAV